jgi:hypothetical protein
MKSPAFLFALLLTPLTTMAVDYDANIGIAKYTGYVDGLWWDSAFSHHVKPVATGIDIGVTENVWQKGHWGIDLREGLIYLGQSHVTAQIPTRKTNTTSGKWVGPDFVGANPANPCSGACTNMSTFTGSGHELGGTLELMPYYITRGIKFSLIGGVFVHRTTFKEDVIGIDAPSGNGFYNTSVATKTGLRFGEIVGLSAQKGNIVIRYQYFKTPGNFAGDYPPPWHGIHLVTIGWRF